VPWQQGFELCHVKLVFDIHEVKKETHADLSIGFV